MEFLINTEELSALCELPHLQQLAYIRGIKPYMDFKTGMVGIKRKISHQSIAEQLYVAPHQGIKSMTVTKIQVRRAIDALARVGLVSIESEGRQLILKCLLAKSDFSASNKVITGRSQQADRARSHQTPVNTVLSTPDMKKAITPETAKVITPPSDPFYICLLQKRFDDFWNAYPEKKSKPQAWLAFETLNPDDGLMQAIMNGLRQHIEHRHAMLARGDWVPPWKYPANWLAQRSWEDEMMMDKKERPHASNRKNTRKKSGNELNWLPDELAEEPTNREIVAYDNVYAFTRG